MERVARPRPRPCRFIGGMAETKHLYNLAVVVVVVVVAVASLNQPPNLINKLALQLKVLLLLLLLLLLL